MRKYNEKHIVVSLVINGDKLMSNQTNHVAEQAVVAIFGALKSAGIDVAKIAEAARTNSLNSASNYQANSDHTIITEACEVISAAEKRVE
jgi:hypothetical protein